MVCGRNNSIELYIFMKVKFISDIVEILLCLRLGSKVFPPIPLVEQLLGERVAVGPAFGAEACARVAVPIPCATDAAAGLECSNPTAKLAQFIELI